MPKLVPNILKTGRCWLNQIRHMFYHYLFATGKILEKMQIIWGRATDSLMFEGKSIKLKIGSWLHEICRMVFEIEQTVVFRIIKYNIITIKC